MSTTSPGPEGVQHTDNADNAEPPIPPPGVRFAGSVVEAEFRLCPHFLLSAFRPVIGGFAEEWRTGDGRGARESGEKH